MCYSKDFQTYNTLMKPVEIGFASWRSAQKRLPRVFDVSKDKRDTIYCVLVVAAAVLVGIVRCTSCDVPKTS